MTCTANSVILKRQNQLFTLIKREFNSEIQSFILIIALIKPRTM